MERRTVVVGLAAVGGTAALGLAGCGPRARAGSPGGNPGSDDTARDRRLVASALSTELEALDAIERARRRHPSLRRVIDPSLDVHRAHVQLLRGAVDGAGVDASARPRVPGSPAAALRDLVRLESAASEEHAAGAMAAASGPLARVLASMSVASAQLEQAFASGSGGAP